jgi:hypothetical protein
VLQETVGLARSKEWIVAKPRKHGDKWRIRWIDEHRRVQGEGGTASDACIIELREAPVRRLPRAKVGAVRRDKAYSPYRATPADRLAELGKLLIQYTRAPDAERDAVKDYMVAKATTLLADLRRRDAK